LSEDIWFGSSSSSVQRRLLGAISEKNVEFHVKFFYFNIYRGTHLETRAHSRFHPLVRQASDKGLLYHLWKNGLKFERPKKTFPIVKKKPEVAISLSPSLRLNMLGLAIPVCTRNCCCWSPKEWSGSDGPKLEDPLKNVNL